MREAIAMHLQGMLDDHEAIPAATSAATYLDISLSNPVA